MYNSVLTVDLDILARNLRAIEAALPQGMALIPVLKCDAYGLGAEPVARTLCRSTRVAAIAVAQVREGAVLRCPVSPPHFFPKRWSTALPSLWADWNWCRKSPPAPGRRAVRPRYRSNLRPG